MSCILTISGKNFDVDRFISETGLEHYQVFYKGEPKLKSKPNGPFKDYNGLSAEASSANFDDFKQQIKETEEFLIANRHKLVSISHYPEIEFARIDFGVSLDPEKINMFKGYSFSNKLIKIAGELCLDINLSVYPHSDDDE